MSWFQDEEMRRYSSERNADAMTDDLKAVERVRNMTESMRRMAENDEQRGIVAALDTVLRLAKSATEQKG